MKVFLTGIYDFFSSIYLIWNYAGVSIKTSLGKRLCYRVKPVAPKNHVFDGPGAVNVWLSADKSKTIVRIRAKMFVGNIQIDLQK